MSAVPYPRHADPAREWTGAKRRYDLVREAAIATAVVTLLNDWLAQFQNYRPLIFGAVLIAVMLFMPGGIASAARLHGGLRAPPKPPTRGAPAKP